MFKINSGCSNIEYGVFSWLKGKWLSKGLKIALIAILGAFPLIPSCQPVFAQSVTLKASWYSISSLKKEGTYKTSKGVIANGKLYNENAYTCATRLYPLGSTLLVTNIITGKSVIVKVTDRISKKYANTRIDLSKGAFSEISNLEQGLCKVFVEQYNKAR